MKKNIFLCLAALLLFAPLLSACHNTQERPNGTAIPETTASETTDAPAVTPPVESSPLTAEPTETETDAEIYEPIAPAPESAIHTMEVSAKAAGEQVLQITDLTANLEKGKTHVRVIPSLGYVCHGFTYGDTLYAGDLIPLSIIKNEVDPILHIDYATYELPIVNISVDGQAIESKTEYVDMTFSMENTEDILVGIHGGIRLRGNSTAGMPKKPYRIKFAQKQSLFGLEKAKSWVLLAEYLDPSCLHNYAAMYLGAASDELAFTPTIHHVNLYLDGEYMGLYSLCEQVEEERLGIEQKITADMTDLMDFSFLVCMDERAPEEDEPYFFVASVGKYFQLKYPQQDDFVSQKQYKRFMNQLETYYHDMANAFNSRNQAWFKKNIYTDALADHLIIDQIMGEKDHVWKSFYSYHDATDENLKGKLSFGPIWDYDYSLYTPWTGEPNESYTVDTGVYYSNFFFQGLMGSRYESKVEARYNQHYADVLKELIQHLEAYHDTIEASLALNQQRWYGYDPGMTEDNYEFMIKFFKSRQKILKNTWG